MAPARARQASGRRELVPARTRRARRPRGPPPYPPGPPGPADREGGVAEGVHVQPVAGAEQRAVGRADAAALDAKVGVGGAAHGGALPRGELDVRAAAETHRHRERRRVGLVRSRELLVGGRGLGGVRGEQRGPRGVVDLFGGRWTPEAAGGPRGHEATGWLGHLARARADRTGGVEVCGQELACPPLAGAVEPRGAGRRPVHEVPEVADRFRPLGERSLDAIDQGGVHQGAAAQHVHRGGGELQRVGGVGQPGAEGIERQPGAHRVGIEQGGEQPRERLEHREADRGRGEPGHLVEAGVLGGARGQRDLGQPPPGRGVVGVGVGGVGERVACAGEPPDRPLDLAQTRGGGGGGQRVELVRGGVAQGRERGSGRGEISGVEGERAHQPQRRDVGGLVPQRGVGVFERGVRLSGVCEQGRVRDEVQRALAGLGRGEGALFKGVDQPRVVLAGGVGAPRGAVVACHVPQGPPERRCFLQQARVDGVGLDIEVDGARDVRGFQRDGERDGA